MSTLYVDRRGAEIDLEGDTIVVRVDGQREGTAPLRVLERVVVRGAAQIGTRLVSRLTERGIGLTLLPGRASAPASVLAPAKGDAALRLAQLELLQDSRRRAALSTDLVRTKLAHQARLLRKAVATHQKAGLDSSRMIHSIEALDRASAKLSTEAPAQSRDSLRGIEGAAAAAYFAGLTQLFAPNLGFSTRNRRPPRDPVNVCLSLGYTILHHRAVQAIASVGLDASIGFYHDLAPGRDSLACDLAETLRPLVDNAAVALFRDGRLEVQDFTQSKTACRMGKPARTRFYRAFEDHMTEADISLDRVTKAFVAELRRTSETRRLDDDGQS